MRALLLVVVALLFSCGHPLRPDALLSQFGPPCEQTAVTVAQMTLACQEVQSERSRCLGAIAEALHLQRLRYCTGGTSPSNCAATACYTVGDYWCADDECPLATFGPPPPAAAELERLLSPPP